MNAQTSLLRAARWQSLELVFWVVAFASPWLLAQHALIINEIAIVALFAVSLDLVLGYTGIVSLGHAAFLGFGAYSAALFAKHIHPVRFWAWWWAWLRPPCLVPCVRCPSCVAVI